MTNTCNIYVHMSMYRINIALSQKKISLGNIQLSKSQNWHFWHSAPCIKLFLQLYMLEIYIWEEKEALGNIAWDLGYTEINGKTSTDFSGGIRACSSSSNYEYLWCDFWMWAKRLPWVNWYMPSLNPVSSLLFSFIKYFPFRDIHRKLNLFCCCSLQHWRWITCTEWMIHSVGSTRHQGIFICHSEVNRAKK